MTLATHTTAADLPVVWMHVTGDLIIGSAYLAIPALLIYMRGRSSRDEPNWLWYASAGFIAACGLTHFLDAWSVWRAQFWLAGAVKLATGAAAIPLIWMLWRTMRDLLTRPTHRQLQEAQAAVELAHRELDAFTAKVSHDLRSPLTTIAGQAGLLEMSAGARLDEDQRRRLQRIHNGVKQISDLLEGLLNIGRISRHPLQPERIDVSALCEAILNELRARDTTRHIRANIQPNMCVHADRTLTVLLLTSVLDNAVKFTGPRQPALIDVSSRTRDAMLEICVRDNGVGFDMTHQEKLFQPFQRLHTTPEFAGLGIGLAAAARVVARHGGQIRGEATIDEGAIFHFTLPAYRADSSSTPPT